MESYDTSSVGLHSYLSAHIDFLSIVSVDDRDLCEKLTSCSICVIVVLKYDRIVPAIFLLLSSLSTFSIHAL